MYPNKNESKRHRFESLHKLKKIRANAATKNICDDQVHSVFWAV